MFKNFIDINPTEQKIILQIGNFHIKTNLYIKFLNYLFLRIYTIFSKVKNNKIVIYNTISRGYGCNPKYVIEELKRRNIDCEIVYIVKDKEISYSDMPSDIKIATTGSFQALKELVTAKIWLCNMHLSSVLKKGLFKPKETKYIQMFHGSLGIKVLDFDHDRILISKNYKKYNMFLEDAKITDYLISNSTFETKIYEKCWKSNNKEIKIFEFGHPRNDVFFEKENKLKEKVYRTLNIPMDKKIILYAPTFRRDIDLSAFILDYKKVVKTFSKKNNKDYVFVIKFHHLMWNLLSDIKDYNNVINASNYPDMQELLSASNILISDYSSCMFDFMLTKKPVFIYAQDIDKYCKDDRGFYYPLESTPFPIAKDEDELIKNILDFDNKKYKKDVENFLIDKGCIEDGHASERVVDLIEEIIDG